MSDTEDYFVFDRTGTPHVVVPVKAEIGGNCPQNGNRMDETSPGTGTVSKDLYIKHGYRSRAHYLKELADQYCVPLQLVQSLAMLLGPSEDFDGLILALEDDV